MKNKYGIVGKRKLTLRRGDEQPKINRHFAPWTGKIIKFSEMGLKAHIAFCLAIAVFGYISPNIAYALATISSPFASAVDMIEPNYVTEHYHYLGSFHQDFYFLLIGEALFVAFFGSVLYLIGYLGRYWKFPWVLNQSFMEKKGSAGIVYSIITAIFSCGLTIFLSLVLYLWLGLYNGGLSGGRKLFQVTGFCIVLPPVTIAFFLTAFFFLSAVTYIMRVIFLRLNGRAGV